MLVISSVQTLTLSTLVESRRRHGDALSVSAVDSAHMQQFVAMTTAGYAG